MYTTHAQSVGNQRFWWWLLAQTFRENNMLDIYFIIGQVAKTTTEVEATSDRISDSNHSNVFRPNYPLHSNKCINFTL